MRFDELIGAERAAVLRGMVGLPDPLPHPGAANGDYGSHARDNGDRWAVCWQYRSPGMVESHYRERVFRSREAADAYALRMSYRRSNHGMLVEFRPRFRGWDAVMAGECG